MLREGLSVKRERERERRGKRERKREEEEKERQGKSTYVCRHTENERRNRGESLDFDGYPVPIYTHRWRKGTRESATTVVLVNTEKE